MAVAAPGPGIAPRRLPALAAKLKTNKDSKTFAAIDAQAEADAPESASA